MRTKRINLNKDFKNIRPEIKEDIINQFSGHEDAPAKVRFDKITYYHDVYNAPVDSLCKALDVSRSAYYEHLKNHKMKRDMPFIEAITEIQSASHRGLGVDKVRKILIENYSHLLKKDTISRNKVYRLMKEYNLTRHVKTCNFHEE